MPDVFALPARLAAKNDPALTGADREHFAAIRACLDGQVAELAARLEALRREPGRRGRGAMDRDLEIHRLSARSRLLQRFGVDICLGRIVAADRPEPTYIGRIGLTDRHGRQLLVDWRTPAAEPFFAATAAHRQGLLSRRRYRWTDGRVTDYWDEAFTADGTTGLALDDDSAFIASLGASRTGRMRDVLGTLQADQDAIIRADSPGALVVDGGPGTGKTVVALHRAAYLLYADPRLRNGHGDVLVVGPHRPYLAYVADVLPSLGEEGVATCTIRDLVPEGADAIAEADPEVERLKSDARVAEAVEPAVALYEEPPTDAFLVETWWDEVTLTPDDWAEAFDSAAPGTPHNEAREDIWEALVDILVDRHDHTEASEEDVRRSLARNSDLVRTFSRAWPILEAPDLVSDLWSVPAYLRRCAPWLTPDERRVLRREEGSPWTVADLPLLDAMRQRLGDPEAAQRRRRREAVLAADRAYMDEVVEDILATDDDPDSGLQLLRRDSLRDDLVDEDAVPHEDRDRLAGPFAHLIVDEAQELTDAEWQLLLRRCPSRSVTIVGDRAQARRGFSETWQERLERVGLTGIRQSTLTVNYRTPAEVMAAAEPVIRAVLPDASVPTSIRVGGRPVRHASTSELASVLTDWLAAHPEGTACVVGDPSFAATDRVHSLAPDQVKGLEFDLVVLVDPDRFGVGVPGAVDRYVAMTRATRELVVLTSSPRPGRGATS
ncbi:MAG: RNA polymerase recycling motor ATPase HelR [Propionicimonas sp.]|uniref:RNA polymerase recycling motor ATPase HelR n=1 Tax=Propionicimonas sp. TaxID=1955623 RepID=UPI003D123C56